MSMNSAFGRVRDIEKGIRKVGGLRFEEYSPLTLIYIKEELTRLRDMGLSDEELPKAVKIIFDVFGNLSKGADADPKQAAHEIKKQLAELIKEVDNSLDKSTQIQ